MQHLFLNKELSVLAKEKEFDEPCLAYYEVNKNLRGIWKEEMNPVENSGLFEDEVTAPLYQQVIDWFREKHNLHIEPVSSFDDTGIVTTRYRILHITPPHIHAKYEGKEAAFSYRDFTVPDINIAITEAFKLI